MATKPNTKTPAKPDPMVAEATDLLDHLDFSPEDVVMAAASTPRLFLRSGEYRIARLRDRNQAKMV